MSNLSVYDELDQAIDQMLAAPEAAAGNREPKVRELVELAWELRDLPRANFRTRLKLELEWEATGRAVSATADADRHRQPALGASQALPSLFEKALFEKTWAGYPVRRINFALSVALHGVMAFLIGAGFLMVKSAVPRIDTHPLVTVRLEPYRAPAGSRETHGGGSGGAVERIRASRGAAPRAAHEQLTPPIVIRNNSAKLVAPIAVLAPPDLSLPRTRQIGDPLSDLTRPSNGPGVGGGLGGNTGDGAGNGKGPGRGDGDEGGCCDGTYAVGNGVSMPHAIYAPEPEFSEEARKSKYQGEVTLMVTIGADGRPRNLTVVRALGMGLDEKALAAVRTWRFDPAKRGGRPVAVQMNIIVSFHLF